MEMGYLPKKMLINMLVITKRAKDLEKELSIILMVTNILVSGQMERDLAVEPSCMKMAKSRKVSGKMVLC